MSHPTRPSLRNTEQRNQLVVQYMGLPTTVARRTFRYFLDLEDARAAGMLGLIRAAELWDETMNTTFLSYAWHWVRKSIKTADYLAAPIIVPSAILERSASHRHRADGMRVLATVPLEDYQPPVPEEEREDGRLDAVRTVMVQELDDREREILRLHFTEGLPLKQIGQQLGYGHEWMRLLKHRTIQKIRDALKYRDLCGE